MDEEEEKKDDVALSDGALDDVLEETDDEDETVDPLAGIDEFGAGGDEKQWE